LDYSKEFKIPFKGLQIGRHHFSWEIGKGFFEEFENTDIEDCRVGLALELDVLERMFTLDFTITGELMVICDRCLETMLLPIDTKHRYIIRVGHELKEESDDVLVIPENEYRIDIYQLLYDYIILAIPLKKVHAEDADGHPGCDHRILEILDKLSRKAMVDPRWEPLLNIKSEKND
jgi:uncharacterized protein